MPRTPDFIQIGYPWSGNTLELVDGSTVDVCFGEKRSRLVSYVIEITSYTTREQPTCIRLRKKSKLKSL